MIESSANRVAILADWAENLTITDGQGGSPLEVDDGFGGTRLPRGVFSFEHDLVDMEIQISSRSPVVIVPTAEIPGVEKNWEVTLSQGSFFVSEPPRHDGLGMSVLILVRAEPSPIG